jgi:hypothetical protein
LQLELLADAAQFEDRIGCLRQNSDSSVAGAFPTA